MKVNTTQNALQSLVDSGFKSAMSYGEYRILIHKLHEQNKVTGHRQTPALLEYSRLNEQRMNRWDKHFVVRDDVAKALSGVKKKYTWISITEGWCGDAAQMLPALEKFTFLNLNISSKYILRDDNPELMDMYLTNESRSIPIIICINDQGEEIWHWGPRPKDGQKILDEAKRNGTDTDAAKEELHLWYARNKMEAFQNEMIKLIRKMQ